MTVAGPRALRIGSLCTGYGGLDMAVHAVYGGDLAWVSDIEPGPCALLAARYPDVPNLGDLTTCDFTQVEPVDILTAGYPCQPFSHAGQRKGTDDERHIWPRIRDAIGVLRPGRVVLENVAGHLSLGGPAVIADLAGLGYDARWLVVRASDIGACHRRARLFIVTRHAESDTWRIIDGKRVRPAPDADQGSGRRRQPVAVGSAQRRATATGPGQDLSADTYEPRPQGQEHHGHQPRVRNLPTPRTSDAIGVGGHGTGGPDLRTVVADTHGQRLTRGTKRDSQPQSQEGHHAVGLDPQRRVLWGTYEPAIRRHEHALGRPAPSPVDAKNRLSPRFVEWMQMLPEGHVTDLGLTRTTELKLLGNGVVPPQAAHALRLLEAA